MNIKKTIPFITSFILAAASLSGCSGTENKQKNTDDTEKSTVNVTDSVTTEADAANTTEVTDAEADETTVSDETAKSDENSKSGSVSVYFSRVGNTDFADDADAESSASLNIENDELKGNAQLIAEWIADEADCETLEVVSSKKYPADYNETVDKAREEKNDGERPELTGMPDELSSYDTIWLTFPNWWSDLPMPVYSFFDKYDLSGKTIIVFVTHEGSGFSNTVSTIKELEPDANVIEGLSVKGGSVYDAEQKIRDWVKDNK